MGLTHKVKQKIDNGLKDVQSIFTGISAVKEVMVGVLGRILMFKLGKDLELPKVIKLLLVYINSFSSSRTNHL